MNKINDQKTSSRAFPLTIFSTSPTTPTTLIFAKINVVGVVGLVENMVSGNALEDVFWSFILFKIEITSLSSFRH